MLPPPRRPLVPCPVCGNTIETPSADGQQSGYSCGHSAEAKVSFLRSKEFFIVAGIVIFALALWVWLPGSDLGGVYAPSEPLARASLTTYTDNTDADAAEEIVAYFEIFNRDGDAASCDCQITFLTTTRTSPEDGDWDHLWTANTTRSHFGWYEIGVGAFQREALIWKTSIDTKDTPCDDWYASFTLRVGIRTETGSLVEDDDKVLCP